MAAVTPVPGGFSTITVIALSINIIIFGNNYIAHFIFLDLDGG
jgi:5,10-methylene-tetrahydrofolate dehydrogenase/methenyl tetrahydrofolate cyclohydrolase